MTEQQLNNYLKSWTEKILRHITIEEINKIVSSINSDRKIHKVIPEKGSELFFKAFRETLPEKTKVIVLGQDPYPTIEDSGLTTFDGLAFSNANSVKPSPSLENILTEIERDIYNGFDIDTLTKLDLTYLTKQGVLLINTAHTVIHKRPNSHIKLWEPFTIATVKAINELQDIVWLMWGRSSQFYKQYITNKTHAVIETSHPSPKSVDIPAPTPFKGSSCFSKCNLELNARNKKEILW